MEAQHDYRPPVEGKHTPEPTASSSELAELLGVEPYIEYKGRQIEMDQFELEIVAIMAVKFNRGRAFLVEADFYDAKFGISLEPTQRRSRFTSRMGMLKKVTRAEDGQPMVDSKKQGGGAIYFFQRVLPTLPLPAEELLDKLIEIENSHGQLRRSPSLGHRLRQSSPKPLPEELIGGTRPDSLKKRPALEKVKHPQYGTDHKPRRSSAQPVTGSNRKTTTLHSAAFATESKTHREELSGEGMEGRLVKYLKGGRLPLFISLEDVAAAEKVANNYQPKNDKEDDKLHELKQKIPYLRHEIEKKPGKVKPPQRDIYAPDTSADTY